MRRQSLLLALALLAVLAGCGASPTDTTTTPAGNETFTVELTGNASATYVVSADLVAAPFENVTVTHVNGTNRTVPVPAARGAVTYGPESGVTAVDPGGRVRGGVYFEGTPAFSVTDQDVPPTGNVVVTVRRTDREVLDAWTLIRCDGHVSDVSVRVEASGVESLGFGCRS